MKFLKKSGLSLSAIVVSGLSMSNPASAQYPSQMQIYQAQCQQGDQYSCIQLEQMYRRNERWANENNARNERWYEDMRDDSRRRRRDICRNGNPYVFNPDTTHCDYIR